MIDSKTLRLITQNGLRDFAAGHILDGIEALKGLLTYCASEGNISRDAESLEKNYHYMLSFLRKGGEDKKRNEVQEKIQRQGAALLEQASRAIRLNIGNDRYSRAWASLNENFGPNVQDNVVEAYKTSPFKGEPEGERQDDLFDLIWTSPRWTPQDTAIWYDFLLGQRDMVQQHLAGATFLAAWEYCDTEKMTLLCLLADSECHRTRITATAYLLMLRIRHREQAAFLPPLPQSLRTRKGRRLIAQVQYEMLLMLLSERDLKQEINEIDKISQDILSNKHSLDLNKFKALVETKGRHLKNRLRRGLDPNLTKIPLLHNCKYLGRISHWFLPFDKTHPLFQSVMIDEKGNEKHNLSTLVDLILDCDVDKMATLYLVANDKDFSKAVQQLDDQELPGIRDAIIPEYTFRFIMQDIYRFFGHSPLHTQLSSPFRQEQTLLDFPDIATLFSTDDCLGCCSLLLEIERAEQALGILDSLIARKGAAAPTLILKGKALMQTGRHTEAQGVLRNAEILQPDNADILRLLTECCAATHRFEEELEYLQRLAEMYPDDDTYRRLIPQTMAKAGRNEEALQLLFKLDYELDGNDENINTLIADTALELGRLDVAERYANKQAETWKGSLRMGHIRLTQGDWKQAISHYEQFVNTYCKETANDIKDAIALLESQWANNKWQTSSHTDLLLIRDILQAGTEKKS